MKYDFDQVIDRRGTDCVKWQFHATELALREWSETEGCFGENPLLPLWVADMDFQSPQPVVDALVRRARHGIYGYTGRSRGYSEAVALWMQKRHDWTIETDWISTTPGIVNALFMAVAAFTKPGEKVLIQPPVYHPFSYSIEKQDRVIARNALKLVDGRYEMDFANLEELARDPGVKLALLCHPHNPVGRIWNEAELRTFGEICRANGVLVFSDEVHGDLVFSGHAFKPYATLGDAFAQHTIIGTSPSKTFNLPGLKTSNILIPNPEIRARFDAQLDRNGLYGLNAFGSAGVRAAYKYGDEWLGQVTAYIEANYRFMHEHLQENLPDVRIVEPEGTYLLWVDFRELGISDDELHEKLFAGAKVYLDDGLVFGEEGAGFMRFNIACPRATLTEALERITGVLKYNG